MHTAKFICLLGCMKCESDLKLGSIPVLLCTGSRYLRVHGPAVRSCLQNSIKNVGIELKNIEHLRKGKFDLASPWQMFKKAYLLNIETKAKAGIKARIEVDTENQLIKAIAELVSKEGDFKKKETGTDKAIHEQKAKATSNRLNQEIKTAEAAVTAEEDVVKTKEADLNAKRTVSNTKNAELRKKDDETDAMTKEITKGKDAARKAVLQEQTSALETVRAKIETEAKTAQDDEELAVSTRDKATGDKLKKQKVVNLKQREKWSLRSVWLKDFIKYLEEDRKNVAAFKKAGAAVKMPTAVQCAGTAVLLDRREFVLVMAGKKCDLVE